jgi:hypothetical protein
MMKKMILIALVYLLSLSYAISASVTTDAGSYYQGQTVAITGQDFSPDEEVIIQINNPSDNVVFVDQQTSDSNGNFSAEYAIAEAASVGNYTIYVSSESSQAQSNFTVEDASQTTTVAGTTAPSTTSPGGGGGGGVTPTSTTTQGTTTPRATTVSQDGGTTTETTIPGETTTVGSIIDRNAKKALYISFFVGLFLVGFLILVFALLKKGGQSSYF